MRLGGANNMRPLSWGGTNRKDPNFVTQEIFLKKTTKLAH